MKKLFLTGLALISLCITYSQTVNSVPSSGNVGLGTSSPNTKLQVCGNVKIDSSLIVKAQLDAKSDLKVDGDVYLAGQLYFTNPLGTSTTFNKIGVIDPNGQFRGVSSSILAAKLYSETCIPFTDGVNTYFNSPVWQSFGGPNIDDPKLITGIDCPAKVGINVQNPVTTLAVNGNSNFTSWMSIGVISNGDAQLTVKASSPTQTGLHVTSPNAHPDGYGILSSVDANNVKAIAVDREDLNEDVFRVWGDGKVEAKSLRLSLSIWSDHVFADDHQLISLEEVSEFITKENHLPGVPTENEVKKNGIDVGENDAILLEKIEETYLYLIQLNEEIKKLKEQNASLKAEVELLKK